VDIVIHAADEMLNPLAPIRLEGSTVYLWSARLDLAVGALQELQGYLSPDEQLRAARFRFECDQQYFIAARGLLRILLGRTLDIKPDQIRFRYGPHGKPLLASTPSQTLPKFNLAHSNQLVLYAMRFEGDIGVDLEHVHPLPDILDMAKSYFSPREVATLQTLAADLRLEAFFNCWTRKEAFIKARGDGLALPLDQFEVSLIPGEPAALLSIAWDPAEVACWQLASLCPAPGYIAAVAISRMK
jgi:4'-phosphopantetheinyl transferase